MGIRFCAAGGTKIPNVTSPYTHSGLSNGVTSYYAVAAEDELGEGAASGEQSAMAGHVPITDITFADANLEAVVLATGATYSDEITTLNADDSGITDLSGVEYLWRLRNRARWRTHRPHSDHSLGIRPAYATNAVLFSRADAPQNLGGSPVSRFTFWLGTRSKYDALVQHLKWNFAICGPDVLLVSSIDSSFGSETNFRSRPGFPCGVGVRVVADKSASPGRQLVDLFPVTNHPADLASEFEWMPGQ